jgi:hypothetical protein
MYEVEPRYYQEQRLHANLMLFVLVGNFSTSFFSGETENKNIFVIYAEKQ